MQRLMGAKVLGDVVQLAGELGVEVVGFGIGVYQLRVAILLVCPLMCSEACVCSRRGNDF